MHREFHVVYEPGDDGWIIARVPEVPGALSQGRTMDEAREMIADALKMLLEVRYEEARGTASSDAQWETVAVDVV